MHFQELGTLMLIEAPQGYIVATECQKAAWQNGYRRKMEEVDGWARWGSTTAKGTIFLAAGGPHGPWHLALDHAGVAAELLIPKNALSGPGLARYSFSALGELYTTLSRVYALAVALPDGPLEAFVAAVENLPRATEAERLVVQRIGQNIFRDRLLTYWEQRCPLTGITDPALLRASHIKPWTRCETDAERLDVHNGVLLSALWDAAFDNGLVTFDDDGNPIYSTHLAATSRAHLAYGIAGSLPLTLQHRERLSWHRQHVFQQPAVSPAAEDAPAQVAAIS
jgi:hypothetical protein